MQLSFIALTLAAAIPMISAAPVDNLPGLGPIQSKHARAIIGQAKKDGVGRHGCEAGIATALAEVRPHDPC